MSHLRRPSIETMSIMARKEIFQKLSLNIRISLYIVSQHPGLFHSESTSWLFLSRIRGYFSLSILPCGSCIVQCPFSILMYQWNDWTSECKPMGSLSSSAYLNSRIFCFDFLFLKSGSGQKELINYLNLIIYCVFPESTWAFFQNSPFPQLDFLYLFCLPALPMSSNRLSRMMVGGWLLARTGTEFTWVSGSDLIILHASPTVTSPRWPASPPSFARHRDPKYPCTWDRPGSSPQSSCLHPCLQLLMMMLPPTVSPFFTCLPSRTLSYQACF